MSNKRRPYADLVTGAVMTAVFRWNPNPQSGYRFVTRELDGKPTRKYVLCDDPLIVPGEPCSVSIKSIRKAGRTDRGAIIVEYVKGALPQPRRTYVPSNIWKQILIALRARHHILLYGPPGSGKSLLMRDVADALGMTFIPFHCSTLEDAADFLATIHLCAGPDGQSVMQFQRSPLLETIERAYRHPRQRFLLGLEEFNRCPTPAQNASLAAMDKTRTIRHPIENKHVVIPSNVSFIAAINRGAQYTGTFDIDRAQLDRFEPIEINYMPAEQEVAFLKKEYPRVGKEKIETIVAIANKIRSAPEMPCELSVRATSGACVFLNDPLVASERGSFLIDVLKSAFCGRLNGHWDEQGSEASIAWRLIQESLA